MKEENSAAGSIGVRSSSRESQLREGLGMTLGTDQGATEPSSTAMGWTDGPLQAGALITITSVSSFTSLRISFCLPLTQNYTTPMKALFLFLSWILDCWYSRGKSGICYEVFPIT